MAPDGPKKKRKASLAATEDSEDETFGAVLDGVLSESEDSEVDVQSRSSSDDDEDLDGEQNDDDDSENSEEIDDALHSDDIPSDDDEDTTAKKTVKENGEKLPSPLDEDGEDAAPNYRVTTDANGGVRYEYDEIDAVYDSDDTDAQEPVNTIGDIPLSFVRLGPAVIPLCLSMKMCANFLSSSMMHIRMSAMTSTERGSCAQRGARPSMRFSIVSRYPKAGRGSRTRTRGNP